MRLLFIKPKHIGDALLLTPTLAAIKSDYPDSEIWVVVRKGTEGILAGCTAIDRLLTTAAPESGKRRLRDSLSAVGLVRELRKQRFDYAFELSDSDRGRWLAWMSGARERIATEVYVRPTWIARRAITRFSSADWLSGHRVEKDFILAQESLGLKGGAPPLVFSRERTRSWPLADGVTDFAVLHPGTRWKRKRWPLASWVALGRHLQGCGLKIILSAGPHAEERSDAAKLKSELGAGTLSTDGQTDWTQLAGLLHRARLFVGVDTAAMHLAAACQCPTVAVFGPSIVKFWCPWRVPFRIVTTPEAAAAQSAANYLDVVPQLSCERVDVGEVMAAADQLLATRMESRSVSPA